LGVTHVLLTSFSFHLAHRVESIARDVSPFTKPFPSHTTFHHNSLFPSPVPLHNLNTQPSTTTHNIIHTYLQDYIEPNTLAIKSGSYKKGAKAFKKPTYQKKLFLVIRQIIKKKKTEAVKKLREDLAKKDMESFKIIKNILNRNPSNYEVMLPGRDLKLVFSADKFSEIGVQDVSNLDLEVYAIREEFVDFDPSLFE